MIPITKIFEDYTSTLMDESETIALIKPLDEKELKQVTTLYSKVSIREDNLLMCLDKNDPRSFENIGGIFNPHSEAELLNIISNRPNEIILAMYTEEHKLFTTLYMSSKLKKWSEGEALHDWQYPCDDLGTKIFVKELEQALEDERVVHLSECVVSGVPGRGTTYALLYKCLKKMWEQGYEFAVLEVYCIMKYTYRGEEYPIQMNNERSRKLVTRAGAKWIGELPSHIDKKGEYDLHIKPNIYGMKLKDCLPVIKEILEKDYGQIQTLRREIS